MGGGGALQGRGSEEQGHHRPREAQAGLLARDGCADREQEAEGNILKVPELPEELFSESDAFSCEFSHCDKCK